MKIIIFIFISLICFVSMSNCEKDKQLKKIQIGNVFIEQKKIAASKPTIKQAIKQAIKNQSFIPSSRIIKSEIRITENAEKKYSPDIARIYFKINKIDQQMLLVYNFLAKQSTIVLDELKNLGVPEDDIETSSVEIEKKYEYEEIKELNEFKQTIYKNKQKFIGYEGILEIIVSTKKFDQIKLFIQKATENEAQVDNVEFDLTSEKKKEAKEELVRIASQDSLKKIVTAVKALNLEMISIERIDININHNTNYYPVSYKKAYAKMEYAQDEQADEIRPQQQFINVLPKKQTLDVNVSFVYQVELQKISDQ